MIRLSEGELLDMLPSQMKHDTDMICLSYALKMSVRTLMEYKLGTMTQNFVELLPECILDVLAVELRTPYYDQKFDIDVKRRLIKGTMSWYMKAGTAAAVKELVSAVFGGGETVEWFELQEEEAKPGEFDVTLGTMPTDDTMKSFLWIIEAAKNARSHLRRMLVTLTGTLDGGDLLEGRTEKGKHGIEILYFLTYYAEFTLSERLRMDNVRFWMGIDFWNTARHDGAYLHNGDALHRLWRRYGLRLTLGTGDWGIRTGQDLRLTAERYLTGMAVKESLHAETACRIPMYFWGTAYHDGMFLHNGAHRHRNSRKGIKMDVGFLARIIDRTEQIGTAAILTRTRNTYFHNGRLFHDGIATHRTIFKKEIVT